MGDARESTIIINKIDNDINNGENRMNNRYCSSVIGGVARIALLAALAPAAFAINTYVGVSGGLSRVSVSDDSSMWSDFGAVLNGQTSVTDTSSTSGSGIGGTAELYAGMFFQPISKLYLGAEINLTGFTGSANTKVTDVQGNFGQASYDSGLNYAVGTSLMPGFVLNYSTLLYLRLGIDYANFTSEVAGDNANSLASSSINQNKIAYRFGLGLDHYITSNLSLRLEGDYWLGSKSSITDKGFAIEGNSNSGVQLTQNFTPNAITVSVGLTYHFGGSSDKT